ncbi:YheC/D-like protein [Paenibacillus cellulosilyticus]|uniref:YheC/D-like protein n=1 Tax=Paenibacillus cellulosilyticus TaxID=375489 RepID=A0A2V2YXG2_9BACL|nr:YheC/YheD family protein [Paenibacillus cellulosilyticus]PWW02850.1 YheC/D-like protein [Paenibacillus cellulosilyticus]QKS45766.1 YheC/YheD family protein [Paenibacillus cellulosilyticus]
MSAHIGSKWRKTRAIQNDSELARHIPETVRMTRSSLNGLVNKYGMVYIKPEFGTYGNGVMRVEKVKSGGYRYQLDKKIRTYADFNPMYASILRDTKGKRYLAQRGVNLLKYKGRRFDLRVMVQWSPLKKWETTGIIGRVAGKQKIVTNYHNGGEIVIAERLLAPHTEQVSKQLQALSMLGVATGRTMKKSFPRVYKIGLDIALESDLKPWILEVNTSPDPYIFLKHPDRRIFRKIQRYDRANTRQQPPDDLHLVK